MDQKKLRIWTLFTQCYSMKYVHISALVFGSSPIPLVRTCTLLGYPFPHIRCKQETSLPTSPSPRIHTLLPSTSSFQYTRNLDIIKCSKLPICFIIFLPLRKKPRSYSTDFALINVSYKLFDLLFTHA